MPALPVDTLRNRTFVGLLIAQFFAAFNDQAIHAAAMFFAIRRGLLNEAQAITLLPILFYAPWAIFCTIAGYLADRYSKQRSLVFWKWAEVGIMLVATTGFYLGSVHGLTLGPVLVLACVFLMGLHSAFFVPAKYGAMPEILTPQLLSRGNGVLESLSFLAVIFGTVMGGVMSGWFRDHETIIGLVLLGLALVGAFASMLIAPIPAANAERPFPKSIYGPLWGSLRTLWGSQPLRVAVAGLAFFTFLVTYMRSTVYLLGETQNPHWPEIKTSIVVGMSALGIGLGSPLAGWLSGRKVELGLVPLGALGMVTGLILAALALANLTGVWMLSTLVTCIVGIGFSTGFYLVPLFTLLQHRAPKASKGDSIAVSNFINVTGAILASAVTGLIVLTAHKVGVAPDIAQQDQYAEGRLVRLQANHNGQVVYCEVEDDRYPVGNPDRVTRIGREYRGMPTPLWDENDIHITDPRYAEIRATKGAKVNQAVIVSRYMLRNVAHYELRETHESLSTIHDDERLPRFLFVGAGLVTLATLGVLVWIMPDLPARSRYVLTLFTRERRMRVLGTHHVPASGPVVLATNCHDAAERHAVQLAVDRSVKFYPPLPTKDPAAATKEIAEAMTRLDAGGVVALGGDALELLPQLLARSRPTVVPVFYGAIPTTTDKPSEPGAAFGPVMEGAPMLDEVRKAIAGAVERAEEH